MRYAYIKSRNVVEELQRIGPLPASIPDGGPDAYVAGLLKIIGQQPILLLSGFPRNAVLRVGNIEARGYRHDSKRLRAVGTPVIRILIFFSALFRLLRFRPDRILCGRPKGPLLWSSFMVSRLLSKPFVYTCHSLVKTTGRSWYDQVFLNINLWIIRHASAVICHGPYLKKHLLDIGISHARLYEFNAGFRDIVDRVKTFEKIPNEIENGKNHVILFIGRVQANKGVFDLLDACTERLLVNPHLRVVYVGEGPHLRELQERVTERGLNGRVTCMGKVPHDAIGSIIRRSRVVVTPTRSTFPEGRCMAAMEGLVMGVPVIAPDFGPFPYLIKHGVNGLLFRTDSVDDLKNRITSLLDDDALYNNLRRNAQKQSEELIDSPVNFAQAIERAFACSPDDHRGSGKRTAFQLFKPFQTFQSSRKETRNVHREGAEDAEGKV